MASNSIDIPVINLIGNPDGLLPLKETIRNMKPRF